MITSDNNIEQRKKVVYQKFLSFGRYLSQLFFNSGVGFLFWNLMVFSFILFLFFLIFALGPRAYYKHRFYLAENCTLMNFTIQYYNSRLPYEHSDHVVRGVWSVRLDSEDGVIINGYYTPWPREWDFSLFEYNQTISGEFHVNATLPTCLVKRTSDIKDSYAYINPDYVLNFSQSQRTLGYFCLGTFLAGPLLLMLVLYYRISTIFRKKKGEDLNKELQEEEEFRRLFNRGDGESLA
jgi:uncharacterized integral membrane protein